MPWAFGILLGLYWAGRRSIGMTPERIAAAERAAVVKALRWAADDLALPDEQRAIQARADAIENGADL